MTYLGGHDYKSPPRAVSAFPDDYLDFDDDDNDGGEVKHDDGHYRC